MRSFLLICPLLLSATAAAQAPRVPTDLTIRSTIDSGGGRVHEATSRMRNNGKGVMRVDFIGANPALAGGYSLMYEGADSTITVVPASMMVAVGNGPAAMLKSMTNFKLNVREQDADARDDGPGPITVGLPTHKYHLTTHAVMDVTIGSTTCAKTYDTVHEVLSAPGTMMPSTMLGAGFGAGMASVDPKLLAAMRAKLPTGVALHDESTMGTVKTVTDITAISFDPLDPALFAVPGAFPLTDTRKMMEANAAAMQPLIETQLKKVFCE